MKLTYKKGKGDKIHISIDGEYYLTVDEGYFVYLSLKDGLEITEAELESLTEKINVRRAYNCAVSLLARRDHSESELKRKLREKGYSLGSEKALEKLKNDGYVDDLRFARSYISELIRIKHYGKKRVEQELYKKGVSREIASEALSEAEFDGDTLESLIRRKFITKITDEKGRQKAVNALMRMGYSYSEIKDALSNFSQDRLSDEVFYE